MKNTFNLFLFLLTLWLIFMFTEHNQSLVVVGLGVVIAMIISLISRHLNLLDDKSEMIFLSLGFYRHFLSLYFKNFFASLKLLYNLAIGYRSFNPTIHSIARQENQRFSPQVFIATINLTAGLLAINDDDNQLIIHAIHEDYFYDFDLLACISSLNNINDDNLV